MVTGVDCVGRRNRSQVSPEPSATPQGPQGSSRKGLLSEPGQSQTSPASRAHVRLAQVPAVLALAPPWTCLLLGAKPTT